MAIAHVLHSSGPRVPIQSIGERMNLFLYCCMVGLLVLRLSAARPAPIAPAASPQADRRVPATAAGPGAGYCVVGPTLCRVRVWTDAQWADMPERERPATAEHIPGLGWVGAVPEICLN